jgi:hypothetical protein
MVYQGRCADAAGTPIRTDPSMTSPSGLFRKQHSTSGPGVGGLGARSEGRNAIDYFTPHIAASVQNNPATSPQVRQLYLRNRTRRRPAGTAGTAGSLGCKDSAVHPFRPPRQPYTLYARTSSWSASCQRDVPNSLFQRQRSCRRRAFRFRPATVHSLCAVATTVAIPRRV